MTQPFTNELSFAQQMDKEDPLAKYKKAFYFPQHNNEDVIYFCGNSLGLQPKSVRDAIEVELNSWKELAIGGYMKGTNPWLYYQQYLNKPLSHIMGCLEEEVTVMNALTVNLHLFLLSFYKPQGKKNKIIMEAGAFPSDQYAVETIVKHYGLAPDQIIIELVPQPGEKILNTKDIVTAIKTTGEELALVLLGGINYYTGQLFDIKNITLATHEVGAIAGFDLAHVAGNVPMQLHDWKVDFAVWCSYKYLNGGPGAVGGAFVHETHAKKIDTPRLGGWWGNEESTRFKMEKGFVPKPNAAGWNLSTAQVFNTVCLKASLTIFEEANIHTIRKKSILLTNYLEFLLKDITQLNFEIITPPNQEERGAQLCLYFNERGKEVHQKMHDAGIVVDYREPGVIRVAPAPLYCSFEDVHRFYMIMKNLKAE
jgi:kynureninase